ncbi:MAG: amidohydrolase [Acidaminococcaceae bacterium]|nr:amidohydrolase [Acidaminococcaceae bacterium]
MNNLEIVALAKECFYWLHRHPELSGEEFQTTERLKRILAEHEIDVCLLPLATGLVAHIGQGKPVVAFRCDIDALPLTEQSGVPYASEYPGKMHACGHDFHAASLLGIALALKNVKELKGTVKFIFQPAEETTTGALQILQTGILDDADVIFGLHCCAAYPRGTIISREGFMNGAVDEFRIDFYGTGAHACRPHLAADPVLMIGSFILEAQTIISRCIQPFHPAIVGITHIAAGTARNVIPGNGFVEGTIRTLYPADRKLIKEKLAQFAERIAGNMGGTAEVQFTEGPPATDNDKRWVDIVRNVAGKLSMPFERAPDSLSGEDFAFYQQKIPGAFIQIGTGVGPMMHHPAFKVDPETLEDAIRFGVELVQTSLELLNQQID